MSNVYITTVYRGVITVVTGLPVTYRIMNEPLSASKFLSEANSFNKLTMNLVKYGDVV